MGGFVTEGGIDDFDFATSDRLDLLYRVKHFALLKNFQVTVNQLVEGRHGLYRDKYI